MTKEKKTTINVQGTAITILSQKDDDFICLTDMAKKFGGDDLIYSWMRNRNTLEFLGIWEQIHNPEFKGGEFDTFKKEAGLNSFRLTPKKWVDATNTREQQQIIYASETDVLNVAMFGKTALQWRKENPGKEGNIRDYSSIEQLLVLANMESMNAEFIRMELPQPDRLKKLNTIAIQQLKSLTTNPTIKKLGNGK